jgi:hypothetical protein
MMCVSHVTLLKRLQNMSSSLMGASILGGNELYGKLKAFKARLLSDSNSES